MSTRADAEGSLVLLLAQVGNHSGSLQLHKNLSYPARRELHGWWALTALSPVLACDWTHWSGQAGERGVRRHMPAIISLQRACSGSFRSALVLFGISLWLCKMKNLWQSFHNIAIDTKVLNSSNTAIFSIVNHRCLRAEWPVTADL